MAENITRKGHNKYFQVKVTRKSDKKREQEKVTRKGKKERLPNIITQNWVSFRDTGLSKKV